MFSFPEEFSTSYKQEWVNLDPDICYHGKTVKEFYRGYSYTHRIDDIEYVKGRAVPTYDLMCWLDENCTDKYRLDYLSIEPKNEEFPELDEIIEPIYGVEYVFVAFKQKRDYIWFVMRWL